MPSLVSPALVVAIASALGCSGDPDGVANEPGHIYGAFGTGESELDEAGKNLSLPIDLAIDPDTGVAWHRLYIADTGNHRVRYVVLE
jgi:hypothetical protein